ncbi:MAG TPA: winged helix-turn-helix domain-containing protein [Acidobacteriota bacterium]|nr:winged helix-turn-helix domain-containing protein [Acidobacteriota bacterium]
MDIEDVFSSKLRIKILKLLMQMGELNVSEIARRLGVNYNIVNGHLKVLEDEDVIQHKVFGRIRLYRLNEHSSKTKAVCNLIETWEKIER